MRYITITSPDINNGLGCRVTLWVAGCTNKCKGCHNRHTWNFDQGKNLAEAWDELKPILSKAYIKGVTFSGGDPLTQTDESLVELHNLIAKIKEEFPDKDVWMYTGLVYEDAVKNPFIARVLSLVDTLVDGPFIEAQKDRSLAFRGSSNQRILHRNGEGVFE